MPAASTYSHPGITVTVFESSVAIVATSGALYDWAHRARNAWPCSDLAQLEDGGIGEPALHAVFDTSGLVDIMHRGLEDVSASELNAFTSDAIAYALNPEHPCYFVTVGQFA